MFVTYSAYCIGACVYLCVCHIASEKVRAGKQCLTTWRRFLVFSKPRKWNQQWRGCDVTVRLSVLLEPRPPISRCSFVIFFLSVPYISISLCLSLYCICLFLPLVCFSPCLYLFFPLLLRCRGVGVCRLFFMNGMRCLLSESYFCADDEHKLWPHFLFCCLPFSDWLRFPSQWQRIWGSSECVLFL